MNDPTRYFTMYNSKIFRNSQIYLDKILLKYELSSGTYPYLFNLEKSEGISQNGISKAVGNDKAMSARTISKLIQLDYIEKKIDQTDGRAFQLYLTEKAKAVLPQIHQDIQDWVSLITADLTDQERLVTMDALEKIFKKTQKHSR